MIHRAATFSISYDIAPLRTAGSPPLRTRSHGKTRRLTENFSRRRQATQPHSIVRLPPRKDGGTFVNSNTAP
jgi:hypothetical protein